MPIKIKQKMTDAVTASRLGGRMVRDEQYRIVAFAACGFACNLLYALYSGILGIMTRSLWFVTMGAYYIILSAMRFFTVLYGMRKNKGESRGGEWFVMRLSGVLLLLLTVVLSGSIYLSLERGIAVRHHEIVMITIAAYTFTKITLAIVNLVKIRRRRSPLLSTIRNISFADAAVSILTLQRSMLVSFEGMNEANIRLMNMATGAAVCLIVFGLGIGMIWKKQKDKGSVSYGKVEAGKSE